MAERFEHIPLDQIRVQKHNVRIHDIDQGIEDLADNIRANGLLQPIAAYYEPEQSKYVILTGQRRLNAYHHLNDKYPGGGFDRIQCKIIDEPETPEKKKALSLSENITQLSMTNPDLIRAVTDLYNVYGDYEMVRQEFGISKGMVEKYVKMARLPNELKEAIQDGKIHPKPTTAVNVALRAVDATSYTKNGPVPIDTVIGLAVEMCKQDNNAADIAAEARRGGTTEEIVDRARERPKSKFNIALPTEMAKKLQRVADSNGESEELRATQYVLDGVDRDYSQLGG